MKVIRNNPGLLLELLDDNKSVMKVSFIADEFTFRFNSKYVTLSKEDDESLYMNFINLLNNDYEFGCDLSYQNDDEIVWLSDEYGDLSDKTKTDKINRLVIKKVDDKIILSCINPFLEKKNIYTNNQIVAFSPSGNGNYSNNCVTGSTFQDDIVSLVRNTLNKEYPNNLINCPFVDDVRSLGGFAEYPEDIDEDYEAFNHCTADEYISAMYRENFSEIGELDCALLKDIARWNTNNSYSSEEIIKGTLMTYKKRTFIETCIEKHAMGCLPTFIGTLNPKLVAIIICGAAKTNFNVLDYRYYNNPTEEEWSDFIGDVFIELNKIYSSLDDKDKIKLLNNIKIILPHITKPKEFGICRLPHLELTEKVLIKK